MHSFLTLLKPLKTKEHVFIFFSFLFSIIAIFVEMIGITAVPILITNFLNLNQKIFDNFFFTYLENLKIGEIIIIIILIFLGKSLITYFHSVYDLIVFKRIRISLLEKIYSKLIENYYLENIKSPSATKIWLIDNVLIFVKLISTYLNLFKSFILIICISVLILSTNVNFFLLFYLVLFLIIFIFYSFFSKKIKSYGEKTITADREITKVIQESFDGFKNVIIYNQFDFFKRKFKDFVISKEKNITKNHLVTQLPQNFLEFIGIIFLCFFIFFSIDSSLNQANFIYILGLVTYGSVRILSFIKLSTQSYDIIKNKSYVIDLITNELNLKKAYDIKKTNFINLSKIDDENILEAEDITFGYDLQKPIIEKLNFKFKKNKFYIIKGKSGSGKSTFIDVLMGILKPINGSVKININKSKIGYVSQECFIINDTVRKNVAFGVLNSKINDEKIKEKLKLVNLSDHILKLDKGINSELTHHGLNLSVGQKQRIGIARALYFEPDVLFLDEPTSAVDGPTELDILKTLKGLSKSMTIIMISHKENLEFLDANILKLEDLKLKNLS